VAVESTKLAQPLVEDDDDESKRRWQRSSGEQAARPTVERRQRLRVGLSSDEIDVGSIVKRVMMVWWYANYNKGAGKWGSVLAGLSRELCR